MSTTHNLRNLPHIFKRKYLPPQFQVQNWNSVEPFYRDLDQRVLQGPDELKTWLDDFNELTDVLQEEAEIRYVQMTCQTDNPEIEKLFLEFIQEIAPLEKKYNFILLQKYWNSPARRLLNTNQYDLFNRTVENQLSLYRESNIPLETQLEQLSQQYQKITGSLTITYDQKEQTLQEMSRYLESPNRLIRDEVWHLITQRRLKEKHTLNHLFDQMLKLRTTISQNAGFQNFRDYSFKLKERFDYSPEDCERFHSSIEKTVLPLVKKIQLRRMKKMKLDTLRPWDLGVDPLGRPPLHPFDQIEQLIKQCDQILQALSPTLSHQFQTMIQLGLLDLQSRKGKAPGGYNTMFSESRLPFIFMNAVGLDQDLRTLLHESGHAMHAFASRTISFSPYQHAPMEFCEVASMSMELLGNQFLHYCYPNPSDAIRSQIDHFEHIVLLFPWIALVDAFQHWIYLHPDQTAQDRSKQWLILWKKFSGLENWDGLEDALESHWHRQLHIFEVPFYYIEYGIAQLGALQVWKNTRQHFEDGLHSFLEGLAVGGSLPLPEIFQKAGIRFNFEEPLLADLMNEISLELDRLESLVS
jgi:oligoendopeptidase F